jgi:rod shape determining protein RodA
MKKDWLLFLALLLIIVFGLTTLYSTVVGAETFLSGGIFNKQLLFVLVSLLVYFGLAFFDYRFLSTPVVIVPVVVVLLILLFGVDIFGVEINNARRWVNIAGIQLQPSEFAKLGLYIASAWIVSLRFKHNVWALAGISAAVALVFAALVFIEPDAGTTIVMLGIWALFLFSVLPNQLYNGVLLTIMATIAISVVAFLVHATVIGAIAGALSVGLFILAFLVIKRGNFLAIAAICLGLLVSFVGYYSWDHILDQEQQRRIETFIDPRGKSLDENFQVGQSKVAIGSGMIFGKGFGMGTQSKLQFLPEHQTDFIFATFAEEFGLVGTLSLLFLYSFLLIRIFRASLIVTNSFGSMLCLAVGTKLMVEIFINISVNMGMIPATGVPLPLMSAGGSMFIVTMAGLGLVQSTLIHRDE